MDITGEIRRYVVGNFLFGEEKGLRDEHSFLATGIVDSTGILELVSFVEESYQIQVADDELIPENFDSINRIAAYVQRKLSGAEAQSARQLDASAEKKQAHTGAEV